MKAISPVIPGHEQLEIRIAENQPQYETLPALLVGGPEGDRRYVESLDEADYIISCFELSDEEITRLAQTRKLYLYQYNFGRLMQPVLITTDEPGA
jgi:hypothetical protein